MPAKDPYGFRLLDDPYFEAEVPKQKQATFAQRYKDATDIEITPGAPPAYMTQDNKRAAECRIYFNSHVIAKTLRNLDYNLSTTHPYKDEYAYRVSKQDIWWELVELYGFRLGEN